MPTFMLGPLPSGAGDSPDGVTRQINGKLYRQVKHWPKRRLTKRDLRQANAPQAPGWYIFWEGVEVQPEQLCQAASES